MAAPRPVVLTALAVAALALAAAPAMLTGFARSVLYPAPAIPVPSPPPAPLVEIELSAAGEAVSAWWLPPPDESAPVVLFLHGNGENLATLEWSGLFDRFAALGAGVLALDYPGYGRSTGAPSEESVRAAALAGWRELVARAGAQRPRVVAGWSLGAAAAAQVAAGEAETVDALVLLSAWTRLSEVAALHFPSWLAGPLLADRYDTLAVAPAVGAPALVVHGADDGLIPAEHGRHVHAALAGPKRWVEVSGAGHNDLLGREATWHEIGAWLSRAGRPGGPSAG
jgi:pimeloyl-ACP methyl ester carboxylesterase